MINLGMDLGTSNTLTARIGSDGKPEIVEIDGERAVPSVIYLEESAANPVVGRAALDVWADPGNDPERCFRRWKISMGESRVIRTLQSPVGGPPLEVTPEYLTTVMVEHVARAISCGLDGEKIGSVLVTVPHGWRREYPEKCRATRMAAAAAQSGGKLLNVQAVAVSEPVAAAAYWLWVSRQSGNLLDLDNKTLMVCDVGGGTFDISLVRSGGGDRPLDVVDAINSNSAGDLADALICASVCRSFNEVFGTSHPESADELLAVIAGDRHPWLRGWLSSVRIGLKERLCERIEQVVSRGSKLEAVRPVSVDFRDSHGNQQQFSLNVPGLLSCLQPFFEEGRRLLSTFLEGVKRHDPSLLPHAVVFAGGCSRLFGLREHILEPVLREYFSSAQHLAEVLNRIESNRGKLDQAIALGAALIANGIVSVQERLLHDIGMIGVPDARIVTELGLHPENSRILVTPVIARGTPLPATISSDELKISCSMEPGEELTLDLVIDDDREEPWVQSWVIPHPGGGKRRMLDWVMEADADGLLSLRVLTKGGREVHVEGRLERQRTGRAGIRFGSSADFQLLPRVSPEALRGVIGKQGGES